MQYVDISKLRLGKPFPALHLCCPNGGSEVTVEGNAPLSFEAKRRELISALVRYGLCEQKPVNYLASVTQTGKCEQNGTPTPDAPVDIVCNNGALKYSANLADVKVDNIRLQYYISDTGTIVADGNNWYYLPFIRVKPNTTYTLSMSTGMYFVSISEYSTAEDSGFIRRNGSSIGTGTTKLTITTGATTNYIRFGTNIDRTAVTLAKVLAINWMLNLGGTAMPYQPYVEGGIYTDGTPEVISDANGNTAGIADLLGLTGYVDAQEIISGLLTKNVEFEVFDGTESWVKTNSGDRFMFYIDESLSDAANVSLSADIILCNIATHIRNAWDSASDKLVQRSNKNFGFMNPTGFTNDNVVTDWTAYLAARYRAGDPVIVLYPLATATTESVAGQTLVKAPLTVTAEVSDPTITTTEALVSTPDPAHPLPVWCNNGVLKTRHQSGLPLGYQLLDFIESTGTQYIDTGITDITDSEFVLDAQIVTLRNGYPTMLGAAESSNVYKIIFGDSSNRGQFYIQPGGGQGYTYGTTRDTSRHTFKLTTGAPSGGTLSIDDESFDFTYAVTRSTTSPLYLFARNNQGAPSSYEEMRAYSLVVKKGGVLVLNLLPVKRSSDNVVGMYDLVSGQFFANQGTDDFIAGSPVNDPIEIYCDGTPEVLTINGQNLVDLSAVTDGYYYDQNGVYTEASLARLTDYIPVTAGRKYTVYVRALLGGTGVNVRCNLFDSAQEWKSQSYFVVTPGTDAVSTITPTENGYLRVSATYTGTGAKVDWSVLQIVVGEYTLATMPPYEPYVAPQTANVESLLGVGTYKDTQEVLSGLIGRKVGIYVFTGEEAFTKGSAFYTTNTSFLPSKAGDITPICTHFRGISSSAARVANSLTMTVNGPSGPSGTYTGCVYFYADRSLYATGADFKAWLAAQYAAGDPVIVIYPLATPTTEQVQGQALYANKGTNTVDSTTNTPPAEMSITYID